MFQPILLAVAGLGHPRWLNPAGWIQFSIFAYGRIAMSWIEVSGFVQAEGTKIQDVFLKHLEKEKVSFSV
jgi:hypothetical protein